MRVLIAGLVLAALAVLPSTPARAAESYDACTGFIPSLPVTLNTQGVWCMNKDLATAVNSGAAITINNHNVTLDCNGFKLGGLAAGTGSSTIGVYAYARLNARVRNCNIRGFNRGVFLEGAGGGHVVEDSRFDGNLYVGISLEGEGNIVRRNMVMDTGGLVGSTSTGGIMASYANITDNVVNGVTAAGLSQYPFGIIGTGRGVVIDRNTVRNVTSSNGYSTGIYASGPGATVRDNSVVNLTGSSGGSPQSGIQAGNMGQPGFCVGNMVAGYSTPFYFCLATTDNQSQP